MKRFFGFRGRLSRLGYWRTMLLLQLAFAPVWCLGLFAILAFGRPAGVILALAAPASLLASVSCCVRRLHDRGRSGWWLIPMLAVPTVGAALADQLLHSHDAGSAWAGVILSFAALFANLWVWVEIGFKRGAPDNNAFGPPSAMSRA